MRKIENNFFKPFSFLPKLQATLQDVSLGTQPKKGRSKQKTGRRKTTSKNTGQGKNGKKNRKKYGGNRKRKKTQLIRFNDNNFTRKLCE